MNIKFACLWQQQAAEDYERSRVYRDAMDPVFASIHQRLAAASAYRARYFMGME